MRGRAIALLAAVAMVTTTIPASAQLPGEAPVSLGPENIVVHEAGWEVDLVHDRLSFPTHVAWKDGRLLVLEAGRYHFAEPYDPEAGPCDRSAGQLMNCGELIELTLTGDGAIASEQVVVDGLADPIGLDVAPDGDVFLTHYDGISFVPDAAFGDAQATLSPHSTGYPAQTTDFIFAPVTGDHLTSAGGEATNPNTTGPMGLAFEPGTGQLHVSQAAHGQPPDDPIVRDVTGLGYDNPYSSAVLTPDRGELSPDEVAARACRNCFDLAFASEGNEHAGELFITENVGPYRLRASPGEDRTPLAGSTPADWNLLDGVNHVDTDTGQITRVVTFRPDSGIVGITPTGITYSPPGFAGGGDEMFVVLHSGFVPMTDDRGQVVVAEPDFTTGIGQREAFVSGLDFPIDASFGPDGAMYVLEFFDGQLWRVSPS